MNAIRSFVHSSSSYVPWSQTLTRPAPYWPCGIVPSNWPNSKSCVPKQQNPSDVRTVESIGFSHAVATVVAVELNRNQSSSRVLRQTRVTKRTDIMQRYAMEH